MRILVVALPTFLPAFATAQETAEPRFAGVIAAVGMGNV